MRTMIPAEDRKPLPGAEDAKILYEDSNIAVSGFALEPGDDYALIITGDLKKPWPLPVAYMVDEGCTSLGRMTFDNTVVYRLYSECPGSGKKHICRAEAG